MEYDHTQIGTVTIAGLMTPLIAVLVLPFWIPIPPEVVIIALLVLGFSLFVFGTLTVTVGSGMLVCKFGLGLIRKEIPLSDIADARPVRNPWFVGWGIRWIPGRCWVWNVSGFQAVELMLKNDKRFRIGTDEPDVLARAIELNTKGMPTQP